MTAKEKSIFLKDGYEGKRIGLLNLLYVEASDNYLTFQEKNKKTIIRMTLGEAKERLPKDVLIRVHKSYIINFSSVEKVEKHQLTLGGKLIPLSVSYQKSVLGRLK